MRLVALLFVVVVGVGGAGPLSLAGPDPEPFDLEAQSPTYVTKSWTVEDGLPHNWIWAIEQGEDGGLWVGTLQGLARFDGHAFTTFPADATGSRIQALLHDTRGRLWIGTPTGLVVRRNGHFKSVEGPSLVRSLDESADGTVWIAGRQGLYRSSVGDEVHAVSLPPVVQEQVVNDVEVVGPDSVWVAVGGRLILYHDGSFRASSSLQIEEEIHHLAASEGGTLWVATGSQILVLRGNEVARFSHDGEEVRSMQVGANGNAWLTTRAAGLLRATDTSLQSVPLSGEIPTNLAGLTRDDTGQWWIGTSREGLLRVRPRLFQAVGRNWSRGANSIYADQQGSIWVGKYHGGLFRYTDSTRAHWTTSNGLPHSNVLTMAEDTTGTLWVGTQGGLARRRGDGFVAEVGPDGKPHGAVRTLYRDSTGHLWLADRRGLFRRRGTTFVRVPGSETLSSMEMAALLRARDGSVWIGTQSRGVARLVGDTLTWYGPDDGVPHKTVRDVHETDDGTIWIATYGGGIARFEGDRFTPVTPDEGLPDGTIHVLHEAPEGMLWMTSNGGVFRVPRSQVEAVADGQRKRIYVQTFGTDDGMRSREANGNQQPVIAEDEHGRLWIPTTAGPTVVDPRSPWLAVPDSLPVRVTGVRADGTPQPLDSLRLAPSTYRLAVDFTAVSLRHADDLSFRYRLDGGAWTPAQGRRTAEYTGLDVGTHRFEVQATIDGETWYTLEAPLRFTVAPHFYETWWFRLLVGLGLIGLAVGTYRWRVVRLRQRQEKLQAAVEERTEELARAKKKTERQADQLAELDEAKNRFFAHISHEFRTPLSLILGPLRDTLRKSDGEELSFGRRQVDRMTRNAERLQRLIDQLLDLATLEAGRMNLERQPGDLSALVERAAEAFRSRAEEKEIDLAVEAPDGRIETRFDPEKVETITSNLVGNAVKFTPAGGQVTVRVETAAHANVVDAPEDGETAHGTVRIVVADTGPGIEPEVQEQIFDRFEQADNSPTRPQQGTGLGLALASALTELHGGTVDVDSALGEGATFTVQIPLVPVASGDGSEVRGDDEAHGPRDGVTREAGEVEGAEHRHREAGTTGDAKGRPTVLVVEDNAEMRAFLREELEDAYAVLEAADGEAGWEAVRAEEPDLVVSDVMMPETDGFELCRRIKEDEELRAIPVLLLTARAGEEATLEGLESGADDYVAKPFGPEELRQRIANHLAARRHLEVRYREEVELQALDAVVDAEERPFVEEVFEVIDEHLGNPDFGVGDLAGEVALSRRQLTRRLKKTLDTTPGDLIQRRRLERARQLLKTDPGTIAEVAYAIGYRSASHFSNVFREEVGVSPSAYVDSDDYA